MPRRLSCSCFPHRPPLHPPDPVVWSARSAPAADSGGPTAAVSDSTVISIDAMGGDFGPPVVVQGVGVALKRLAGRDIRFLLHGDAAQIKAELAKLPRARAACEIRHTDKVI